MSVKLSIAEVSDLPPPHFSHLKFRKEQILCLPVAGRVMISEKKCIND